MQGNIQCIRRDRFGQPPGRSFQRTATDHLTFCTYQHKHELKLTVRQVHTRPAATQAPADRVDDKTCPLWGLNHPGLLAPQQGAYTSDQFVALERLGQVVVGTGLQAIHAVMKCIPSSQQQAGNQDLARTQVLQPRQGITLGQTAIEHQHGIAHLSQAGLGFARTAHGIGCNA